MRQKEHPPRRRPSYLSWDNRDSWDVGYIFNPEEKKEATGLHPATVNLLHRCLTETIFLIYQFATQCSSAVRTDDRNFLLIYDQKE